MRSVGINLQAVCSCRPSGCYANAVCHM